MVGFLWVVTTILCQGSNFFFSKFVILSDTCLTSHILLRQEVMDLMDQSGKYDKKFKGFTSEFLQTSDMLVESLNFHRV